MKNSEKHMCYACFKQLGDELPRNMEKIHVEFPKSAMEEMLPEVILMHLMDEAFPKVWNDRKSELKGLSSKEIAEQMFAAGVGMTADFMVHLGKEAGKKENRTK